MNTEMKTEESLSTEVMRLMRHGASNDRIFDYIAWDFPTAYDIEEQRLRAAEGKEEWEGKEYIPYDPKERQRLYKLIETLRVKFKQELKRTKVIDDAIDQLSVTVPLSQVEEIHTGRFTTGYRELDRVFGSSRVYDANDKIVGEVWGLARGKLMLLAGEPGVGKTRFYVALAIKLAEEFGLSTLIFQTEYIRIGEFKNVIMNMYRSMGIKPKNLDLIIVRQDRNYQAQCRAIREIRPDLVISDSYNLTHGAKTKSGIEDICFFWKEAMGSHTAGIMIAHTNERKKIKDNNHVQFLVDGTAVMIWANKREDGDKQPSDWENRCRIQVMKNRQGAPSSCDLRHVGDHFSVIQKDVPVEHAEATSASKPPPKALPNLPVVHRLDEKLPVVAKKPEKALTAPRNGVPQLGFE
jgi:hypothetical protein